jgi:hypothetical protein
MKGTLLIIIAMLFLFSCSVKQVTAPEAERIFKDAEIRSGAGVNLPLEDIVTLEKRVKTYWDARMAGDHAKMYEFEDPDVIKKQNLTLTGYIQSKSPAIVDKSYQVKGLEIVDPEKVRVLIILEAFINIPQVMKEEKAVIKDIWQKKQGQWYRWLVLNPFSVLNESDRKKIEAEPYKGPVGGGMPESGTKIENPPVQKEVPGEDSRKEKAIEGMPESGTKIEITPTEIAPPK